MLLQMHRRSRRFCFVRARSGCEILHRIIESPFLSANFVWIGQRGGWLRRHLINSCSSIGPFFILSYFVCWTESWLMAQPVHVSTTVIRKHNHLSCIEKGIFFLWPFSVSLSLSLSRPTIVRGNFCCSGRCSTNIFGCALCVFSPLSLCLI